MGGVRLSVLSCMYLSELEGSRDQKISMQCFCGICKSLVLCRFLKEN